MEIRHITKNIGEICKTTYFKNLAFKKQHKLNLTAFVLLTVIFLALTSLYGFIHSRGVWSQDFTVGLIRAGENIFLEEQLNLLKSNFETKIDGIKDQSEISALAIKAATEAWILATMQMGTQEVGWNYNDRLKWLDEQWSNSKTTWQEKEICSLKIYHEALAKIASNMVTKTNNTTALLSLDALSSLQGDFSGNSKTATTREAEIKVFLTNRLVVLLSLIIRMESKTNNEQLDDIMEDMLNRADIISYRKDIHYQARMDLLYLNNAQSMTSMNFLLARLIKPMLKEAETVESAWLSHINEEDNQVSDQISLTWVANAQLSFPMAYWLTTER